MLVVGFIFLMFNSALVANARILFQDDLFSDIASEGLRLNFDDTGDENVTLQFGNDGTDGSIIWNDASSLLTIGDNVGGVAIDTPTWNIDISGAATGFTGFSSTSAFTLTANLITLNSATDIVFDDGQLTGVVQLTDTATDWAASLPTDGIIDNINSFTSTTNGEGASLIGLEDSAGNYTSTNLEGALAEISTSLNASGAIVDVLKFYPEYKSTVYDEGIYRGRLDSIVDATEGNAYKWTTQRNSDQFMTLKTRFVLPGDFADGKALTLRYKTLNAVLGTNSVGVEVYNVTDSQSCGTATSAASATWNTLTLAEATIETGCTAGTVLNAGDVVEVRISMMADNTGTGEAYVGAFRYDYLN